jgi:hypothetical protein
MKETLHLDGELSERDKAEIIDGLPESNLILFCPGLQGRGNTLIDRSSSAYTVTLVGTTWGRTKRGYRELVLANLQDLTIAGFSFGQASITILVWVCRSAVDSGEHYILGDWVAPLYCVILSNVLTYSTYLSVSGIVGPVASTTTINDGKYHLCGFRYNGAQIDVLVDGVAEGTPVAGTGTLLGDTRTINIGSNRTSNPGTPGYLQAEIGLPIMIYNRALTDAQALRIFNRQRHLFGV